jgi:hypothetical protein
MHSDNQQGKKRNNWYHLLLFLTVPLAALAGCVALAPQPAQPEQALLPSPTLISILANQNAIPTSAIFNLQATFTPFPTETPFVIDDFLAEGDYGPKDFPTGMNPLTGLMVADPTLLERRPMVIKVTNFPRSVRPQWGLSLADHIYEYYLEDGLTRFVGVFYGQDAQRVGPIRSARPFDEHLVRMYKGIFAFAYADRKVYDPLVESDLRQFLVIQRPDNCPPMCRIGPDWDYNTLYTDTALLSQYVRDRSVDNARQNLEGLRFVESTAHGGGEVRHVFIRYSSTSHHLWQYDPESNRYLRSQEVENHVPGEEIYEPMFDSLTGQRIAADNLIILMVPAEQYYQSNSTDIYNFNLIGTGTAYTLRDGRIFKVAWNRPTPESLISLEFSPGYHYPLKPGNVWFEVLTSTAAHKVEANGVWRFTFDLGPG